ncbi:hypothetical protein PS2_191 [Serratia phage PS2]|uniref:Uncharacterized protein n=1 Tax=Serratia phage PS2 TaxID=1481112 RepID=A0A023W5T8_9CAUD|nr:hypothetical protein FF83_gp224 [Serratia phage PS2]AHY25433.1 hypothetical protein PS2_191 [Serratia phage PS2]
MNGIMADRLTCLVNSKFAIPARGLQDVCIPYIMLASILRGAEIGSMTPKVGDYRYITDFVDFLTNKPAEVPSSEWMTTVLDEMHKYRKLVIFNGRCFKLNMNMTYLHGIQFTFDKAD